MEKTLAVRKVLGVPGPSSVSLSSWKPRMVCSFIWVTLTTRSVGTPVPWVGYHSRTNGKEGVLGTLSAGWGWFAILLARFRTALFTRSLLIFCLCVEPLA